MTSTDTTRVRSGAANDATGASGGLWGPGAPREGAPSSCVSPAAAGRPVSDVPLPAALLALQARVEALGLCYETATAADVWRAMQSSVSP